MERIYHIEIKGLDNPVEFVNKWSGCYKYSDEWRYGNHINTVLDDKDSFIQLFKWKNGTGDTIYSPKMKVITEWSNKLNLLKDLRTNFDWDIFETEFRPTKSSSIWKIFLLHLINPDEFPMFDQHVFRFYNYHKNGVIEEIPKRYKDIYLTYKNEYRPWFNSLRNQYNLNSKQMDMSFFTYGQILKRLKGLPIEIKN